MTTSESDVLAPDTLPAMRFRAFPVAVVIEGILHEPALLWATDDRTEVWVSGENRTPMLIATLSVVTERERAKGLTLEGSDRRSKFRLVFVDGTDLLVGVAPGCGCGHPLKSFSPPKEADQPA